MKKKEESKCEQMRAWVKTYDRDDISAQVLMSIFGGTAPKETNIGLTKTQARVYLHRFVKEGLLMQRRDKDGNKVHYAYDRTIATRSPEPQSKPQVIEPIIQEETKEIESEKIIPVKLTEEEKERMPPNVMDYSKLRVHGWAWVLKESLIAEETKKRYIIHHSLFNSSENRYVDETFPIGELFNPVIKNQLNNHSILQLWDTKGYKENTSLKSQTGTIKWDVNRTIKIEIYQNNTVIIYIEASDNPLDVHAIAALMLYLKSIFEHKAGLRWTEIWKHFIIKNEELNIDGTPVKMNVTSSDDPFKCITVEYGVGKILRDYSKQSGDETYLRSEFIIHPDAPVHEHVAEIQALMMGGASYSWTMQQSLRNERAIKDLAVAITSKVDAMKDERTLTLPVISRILHTLDRIDEKLTLERERGGASMGKRKAKTRTERKLGTFEQGKEKSQ